jgi:sulfatase maturation enzyme AslB (radical SAM superfamily)
MNSNSKPLYCGYAWRGLFINEFAQGHPCCFRVEDANEYPREKNIYYRPNLIYRGESIKEVRRSLLEGKFPAMCKLCENAEKNGEFSKRLQSLERSYLKSQNEAFDENEQELGFLDIHLGDQCNLECRMCTPRASRRLRPVFAEVFNDHHVIDLHWQNDPLFWEELNRVILESNALKRVHFAGGEPLIIKKLWEFLEQLDTSRASKLILSLNSNLTVIPPKFEAIIEKFKKVRISISLEGTKEVHNYIRYPSNRDDILNNLNRLRASTRIEFNVSTVVQTLNVFNLPQFFKELETQNLEANLIFVEGRDFLDIKNIPLQFKQKIKAHYLSYMNQLNKRDQGHLKQIMSYLERSEEDHNEWDNFWKITRSWDALRRVRIQEIVPELS